MLGLGESDHVLDFGVGEVDVDAGDVTNFFRTKTKNEVKWNWQVDADYIYKYVYKHKDLINGENFYFISQDWGGGICFKYASNLLYRKTLLGYGFVDPIALMGYPIQEIQAVGQSSALEFDAKKYETDPEGYGRTSPFSQAMGAAQQTFVQIFKTMVREEHSKEFNNFGVKRIMDTYVDTDYERSARTSQGATSMTMNQNVVALRALAQRSAVLSPSLLLPKSHDYSTNYPSGIHFSQFKGECLILWGAQDNMMPAVQRYMLRNAMPNCRCTIQAVPNAGHFSDVDQPEHVAGAILDWIIAVTGYEGPHAVADIFQGFERSDVWHGSEKTMFDHLRNVYRMGVHKKK